MKNAIRRTMQITTSFTAGVFLASLALLFFGQITFSTVGFYTFIAGFSSLAGSSAVAFFEYRENSELAELCNCAVEDIYLARTEFGWHKDWIKANASSFHGYLAREKQKRAMAMYTEL